jgi:aspartyl protease family protein
MDHPRRASRDPLKGAESRGSEPACAASDGSKKPWLWYGCGLQGAPAARPELVEGRFRGATGWRGLLALPVTFLLASSALAQSVALSGVSGSKALLVVDGGAPRFVAAGQVHQGVRVLSVQGQSAMVVIGGQRQTLRVGEAPIALGGSGAAEAGAGRVVLTADAQGHFMPQGQINGRAVQFMVDTGASQVVIGEAEARRLGLAFEKGRKVQVGTANGVVAGHQMQLDNVRVGEAQVYGVSAIVLPQPMPFVLLGNSFLTRFQMQRTNDQMTLEKRY